MSVFEEIIDKTSVQGKEILTLAYLCNKNGISVTEMSEIVHVEQAEIAAFMQHLQEKLAPLGYILQRFGANYFLFPCEESKAQKLIENTLDKIL